MLTRLAVISIFVLSGSIASIAHAADEAAVLRMRAEQLAAENRCEEALPRAVRARELAPTDAGAALVEGRCALVLKRYDEVVAPLEEARRLDPSIPGIAIDLTITHFQQGDYVAAERELASAEQEMPDDPRVSLYRGLLLIQQAKDAEAAQALERAGRLDHDIDPLASYYAGLAWGRANERERAAEALERVQTEAPGSDWAQQAALAMDGLDAPYKKHWWASASAGIAYDSNVVLAGTGVILPAAISDEADTAAFWSLEGGYELLRDPDWSAGVIGAYEGNAYFDLNEFNLQYPSIAGWVDRRIDEDSFVRLQPFGGYAWRDAESFLGTVGGNLAYYRRYSQSTGRLFGEITYDDYRFTIPNDAQIAFVLGLGVSPSLEATLLEGNEALKRKRNRDGVMYTVGYEQSLEVRDGTDVRAGAAVAHYESNFEFTHNHIGAWLGASQQLPWRIDLDVMGSYAYEPYENPSTFVDPLAKVTGFESFDAAPKRRDNVWNVQVLLERPIKSWLKASATWRYTNNDSNTDVFKYDRHIVGGFITVAFGG